MFPIPGQGAAETVLHVRGAPQDPVTTPQALQDGEGRKLQASLREILCHVSLAEGKERKEQICGLGTVRATLASTFSCRSSVDSVTPPSKLLLSVPAGERESGQTEESILTFAGHRGPSALDPTLSAKEAWAGSEPSFEMQPPRETRSPKLEAMLFWGLEEAHRSDLKEMPFPGLGWWKVEDVDDGQLVQVLRPEREACLVPPSILNLKAKEGRVNVPPSWALHTHTHAKPRERGWGWGVKFTFDPFIK